MRGQRQARLPQGAFTRITGARRRPRGAIALAGGVVALLALTAIPASGLAPGTFEGGDGNMTASTGKDWATLAAVAKQSDFPPGSTDDSFNSKEDDAVPKVVAGSIPPNKSDLQRLYVATENVEDPAHVGDANFNKDMLYLGWTRVQEPSGTTNMDFELNQSETISSNGVTPVRTAGDVLITYDLSQGGTIPLIRTSTWLTSGPSSACEASGASVPCWSDLVLLAAPKAEGAVNAIGILNALDGNAPLSAFTFGEAAINLQAAGIFGAACRNFGSAYVKSRSSDSFTAAMKDYIRPVSIELNSCPDKVIKLKKVDGGGTGLAGATLQLWRDSNGTAGLQTASDTLVGSCTTTAPDGIGNCTFTIGLSGTYIARETVAPAGYTLSAPDVTQVITIDKNASAPFVLQFTDTPEPGQFTVKKRNASGTIALDAQFSLYRDVDGNGAVSAGDTLVGAANQSTGADGDLTYTGLQPGKYVVKETVAPAGYDLPVITEHAFEIVIAAGGDSKTFTFNDTPTKGSLTVLKRAAANHDLPLAGAHFTLWLDDGDGVFEPVQGGDTNVGTCESSIGLGMCTFSNLVPATYFIQETQAPSGYDLPATTYQTVVIGITPGGDSDTATFYDVLTTGSITVHKQDDDDPATKLAGATFAIYADADDNGVPDGGALDTCQSGADGTGYCTFADLAPGTYLVEETAAPNGYDLPPVADRIQSVTVSQADGGDDVNITFSDPRKFRVIVLVCKEDGNTLYPSSVTFDGSTKTSADATGLPAGVSQAQACAIDGARFTGKHYGIYAASANIPK